MPTISAKIIKSRVNRVCEGYWCQVTRYMESGTHQMRLYGNADDPDPKYTMYICLDCAKKSNDKKIKDALSAFNQSLDPPEEG